MSACEGKVSCLLWDCQECCRNKQWTEKPSRRKETGGDGDENRTKKTSKREKVKKKLMTDETEMRKK